MSLESIINSGFNIGKRTLRKSAEFTKWFVANPKESFPWLGKEVAKDITKSTALLVVATPFQVAIDTVLFELVGKGLDLTGVNKYVEMMAMTNSGSIDAKYNVALLTYFGIGFAYANLREVSRRYFGAADPKNERAINRHDLWYTAAFSTMTLGLGYAIKRKANAWQIGLALAINFVTQRKRGPWIGYSIDCFKDLLGFEECKRTTYPQRIKSLKKPFKVAVAAGVVAASLALTAGMYKLTPSYWSNPQRLEEKRQQWEQEKNSSQGQLSTTHSEQFERTAYASVLEESLLA